MRNKLTNRIWIYSCVIMGAGLLSLYSASFQNVRVGQGVFYDQLACVVLGIGLMYLLERFDYRRFYDVAYIVYFLNFILLLFVLLAGKHALGAKRWLEIGGLSFQPSEFTKLSLILMLGRYFANQKPTLSFNLYSRSEEILRRLILPFVLTLILMFLIFKQPDLGTSILLFGIFLSLLFVSGLEFKYIFGFIIFCLVCAPFGWQHLKEYQKDRLLVFLNPNIDPLGAGYTIIQSKIAIGSGQLFGKGWLSGTQNQLNFLPERHTDFIFSVVGEEWGLIGSLLLVFCYFVLIITSLKIAEQVKDKFGTYVTIGIASILTLQVVINIGMVMGLFPVVGITLPFISYGRSSLIVFIIMMGFLLNLSKRRTIF